MITLRVVLDDILRRSPRGLARYAEELTRALVENAPRDCAVEGVASALSEADEESLRQLLPGLSGLKRLPLGRRELRAVWRHGLTTRALGGMVHSPSLFAPLTRHDRRATPGEQTVVTIHDASPWLFEDGADMNAAFIRQMAKRARKHADAVVVPTHATAETLQEHVDFGGRIRVIGGAVSSSLALPSDVETVASDLLLPEVYAVAVGTLAPRKGIEALMRAAASPRFPDIPLLLVGPRSWGDRESAQAVFESGAPAGRIRHLGNLSDPELAVVLDRATVAVVPSLHEGFGLTAIEALHFGTPLVHSDAPALLEVIAGAGIVVEREPGDGYPERLAHAVAATVEDADLRQRLSIEGHDRARAFSWRDSAERVWQLHADL